MTKYPSDSPALLARPPWRRRWVLITVAVVAFVLAGGCWAYATGHIFPRGFTATGTVAVDDDSVTRSAGSVCFVSGTYPDVVAGAQVVITDAASKTVAIGALGPGRADDQHDCVFPFSVRGVPSGLGFYGVEVAHRGRVQFTEAEMHGDVRMTLD
jgi:hypothetical protein